jgi:hypothetical protein
MTAGLGHGWGGRGDPDAERLHRIKGQGGDERLRDEGRPSGCHNIPCAKKLLCLIIVNNCYLWLKLSSFFGISCAKKFQIIVMLFWYNVVVERQVISVCNACHGGEQDNPKGE